MKGTAWMAMAFAAALAAAELDGPMCGRVMTDCGCVQTYWNMTSSWRSRQQKTLRLEVPLAEVARAAVEYEIAVGPFDPAAKRRRISDPSYPWGNWQVLVNGRVVFEGPGGPHVTKGWHQIEIPVSALKPGDNRIEIGWARNSARCGYVYFACDLTEASAKIANRQERLAKHPEDRRIRLVLEFRGPAAP